MKDLMVTLKHWIRGRVGSVGWEIFDQSIREISTCLFCLLTDWLINWLIVIIVGWLQVVDYLTDQFDKYCQHYRYQSLVLIRLDWMTRMRIVQMLDQFVTYHRSNAKRIRYQLMPKYLFNTINQNNQSINQSHSRNRIKLALEIQLIKQSTNQ